MNDKLHPVLRRQLKKLGADDISIPSGDAWRQFLERVNQSYVEHDRERYTLERSLGLTSEEMQELNLKVEKHAAVLRQILTRYVAEEVADDILTNPEQKLKLGGETRLLTVLFANVRNYSGFSAVNDARVVIEVLNAIFQRLVPIIFDEHGTFDKFMGDALMAFFGAPTAYGNEAFRAVRSAIRMREAMANLRENDPRLGQIEFGVGIVTGYAVVGNLGSERLMNYTCIGDAPNLAKALQEHAKGGQVLICPATYEATIDWVAASPTEMLHIRGKKAAMLAYEVQGLRGAPPEAGAPAQ